MPSHNLASIKINDLEIIGYSVAGEETVVAMPQLDVCFDVGKAPDQIIPINHILLTHGQSRCVVTVLPVSRSSRSRWVSQWTRE